MFINDIQVRPIRQSDVYQLFDMAKQSLHEKGVEHIRDDILMAGVKNSLVKTYSNKDFGLFKLNTLIGFAFVEITAPMYIKSMVATLDTVFVLEEFRTKQNYQKMMSEVIHHLVKEGIKNIKTTDDWTLCNNCEIFVDAIKEMAKPITFYKLEIE